ncbi:hypothetical protein DTO013E5_7780 [Penicillium roqueforti]|uniref:Genomic scaffold, ProqFM164S01 n=1 Tax=Penicillium roqueforti (strain FM164) TaxID=1365484 RepID=W6PQ51_PENRF|nr:uncharacterized protein LCP9604111_8026 [Penicillium roqueforti]CDM26303.1 unnamed protein product [Penicillium roqueforti FM164]KAF9242462.1 hypothetical protein LCP9604111_8026 [Penicillium roqueforti]KAI1834667.1 hypothetical protein CBS147337_4221 [Penicillium roqueforti]KAI2676511.1 hypothetical protein CBS147355_5613 [Penicillium roqueforti]KAI2681266.1 hypothetical protein LCP963914a_6776 [Penicillium roqueforti]
MGSKFQVYIDRLHTFSLAVAIQEIADLMPGLTSVVPQEYGYFVQHPDFEGIGNLNDIGTLWLKLGSQCHDDRAPLKVRLVHVSQDDLIYEIYGTSYRMLNKGLRDGTVAPPVPHGDPNYCPCCSGEASATILAYFHERQALYFTEEEYKGLWGDQPNAGEKSSGWTKENGWTKRSIRASKEQIEEALARARARRIAGML